MLENIGSDVLYIPYISELEQKAKPRDGEVTLLMICRLALVADLNIDLVCPVSSQCWRDAGHASI